MTDIPGTLSYAVAIAGNLKYPLVFLGAIIEGPIVMLASGFLLHFEVFSLVPLFLTLVFADLAADIGWYYVGYFFLEPFLKKHGHFLSVTPELLEKAKGLFARYHIKILLISKLTIGFGMALATLVAAGATKVPIKMFVLLNLIGEIALVALLLLVGFYFGKTYNGIASGFKIFFLVGGFLIFAAAIFGFSRYMKNKITNV